MVTDQQILDALTSTDNNISAAARLLGISRSTLRGRMYKVSRPPISSSIKMPEFPDDDIAPEEIIHSMCKRFEKRAAASEAKKWMKFEIAEKKPIGICWFGDPHIDDDGCNWPLLKQHIEMCKNTPGMYGANIGDTHNNWVGRLMKLYADQETSKGTAYKLIEWFFRESGINWLIMLLGNHDEWNDGGMILKRIAAGICPMIDWRAQFKLVFPNGRECLIDAAHDFPGGSQWNPLHGLQKASVMGGTAHLYVAGHRHNWAAFKNEDSNSGRVYTLIRARGYKFMDKYAEVHGYGSQAFGSSIVTIIDPNGTEESLVRFFVDPLEGADYLTWLRKKS